MSHIRLTKRRLKALDTALSFDDLLYEKFRHLNAELNRRATRLIRNRLTLWRVIQEVPGKNYVRNLQVISVNFHPETWQAEVRVRGELADELGQVTKERDRLRANLVTHGHHHASCALLSTEDLRHPFPSPCTCGLTRAPQEPTG